MGWVMDNVLWLFVCFYARQVTSEKGSALTGKDFASKESKKFTIKVNPLSEGRQNVFNLVPPPLPPLKENLFTGVVRTELLLLTLRKNLEKKKIKK